MAAVSHRASFVCFPLGKVASSSLKDVVFQLDTGRRFNEKDEAEIGCGIDGLYPWTPKEKWLHYYNSYTSLVIVRDPIKRLLSAYSDRVMHMKSFHRSPKTIAMLEQQHLSTSPSLDEFVDNLEPYLKASPYIRKHVYPQARVLGRIWDKIKFRLPIERIAEVPGIVQSTLGVSVELAHEHKSAQSIGVSELNPQQFNKLRKRYAVDYGMLKEFYSPKALR